MKKIIFNRKTIDCEHRDAKVFEEGQEKNGYFYYFFDEKNIYRRVNKKYENKEFFIELNYRRYSV